MRLIDADVLGLTDMEIIMCNSSYKEALKMLIDKIDNAPTIIPKHKQGKWIEHEWAEKIGEILVSNYECTECHEWMREVSDFCPNCGAEMMESEENNV